MTKTLFRKLNNMEATLTALTGVITIALGSPWLGGILVLVGFITAFSYGMIIESYEKEGYKFED